MNFRRHRGQAGTAAYAPRTWAEQREEMELIRQSEEQRLARRAAAASPEQIRQNLSQPSNAVGSADAF